MLRLILLLCAISAVLCIYESQLGEYDSLQTNIGFIKEAIHSTERIYGITEDRVVTCIDTGSGSLVWRVVIPEGSEFLKLSISERDGKLFTLVKTPCAGSTDESCVAYEAQAYNLAKGLKAWGMHLGSCVGTTENCSDGVVDLTYLSSSRQIGVISGNTFYQLSSNTGTVTYKYDPQAQAQVDSGDSGIRLSKVNHPSNNNSNNNIIALGCKSKSDTTSCGKAAIISKEKDTDTDAANKAVTATVEYFTIPTIGLLPKDLTLADDSIIGTKENGIFYTSLSNGKVSTTKFRNSGSVGSVGSFGSFALTIGDKTVPGGWKCASNTCEAISFINGVKKVIVSCSGDSVNIGFARSSHTSSTVTKVVCAYKKFNQITSLYDIHAISTKGNDNDENIEEIILQGSTNTNTNANTNTDGNDNTSTSDSRFKFNNFHSIVSITALTSKSKLGGTRLSSVLIVGSNGETSYYKTTNSNLSKQKLWTRQEGLARIEEAVLVSRTTGTNIIDNESVNPTMLLDAFIDVSNEILDIAANKILTTLGFKQVNSISQIDIEKKKLEKIAQIGKQSKRFGFDKIAICLTRGHSGNGNGNGNGNDGVLSIVALDVLTSSVLWSEEISKSNDFLTSGTSSKADKLLKLVYNSSNDPSNVKVILSNKKSKTTRILTYDIENGLNSGSGTGITEKIFSQQTLNIFSLKGNYVLLMEASKSSESRIVMPLYPSSSTASSNTLEKSYVYHIDKSTGVLETYQLALVDNKDKNQDQVCQMNLETKTCVNKSIIYKTNIVATANFPLNRERIIDIASPAVNDVRSTSTIALSDDSVLLKYVNNNICLVTTEAVTDNSSNAVPMLYTTLVDTVSGKVIYRSSIEGGSAPANAALIENTIALFYWNAKAKRSEVSSIHLYEGMIDKHGLTPLASKHSATMANKYKEAKNFSSFLSGQPLAMQKTYIMPKAITAVHHTITEQGIANKNLLVSLTTGQIFMLDQRQISPRRPLSEPTQHEMMDGLQQFNPFLQLNPLACITHNYALGSGAKKILSISSRLESSSMVFSFGTPDFHINRVLPSLDFDLLGADFNYPLLTLLLAGLGVLVYWLQQKQRKSIQSKMWE
jgi:hypothetical protein